MRMRLVVPASFVLLLACAAPKPARGAEAEAVPAELRAVRLEVRKQKFEIQRLKAGAHEALDAARYEDAVRLHKESAERRKALELSEAKLRKLVESLVRKSLDDLRSEHFAVREAATRHLARMCAGMPEVLEPYLKEAEADAEMKARLTAVMAAASVVREDELGRLHQWAATATASSEYGNDQWAAKQATGKPDTEAAGDAVTAWAPQPSDGGNETLVLGYEVAVVPARIRIHETFNAGAVSKIEAKDPKGAWAVLWEGPVAAAETPRWFDPEFKAPAWITKEVRITVDNSIPGWNEIDAVELVGAEE